MPILEMIKYHNKSYPIEIHISTEEITGHFDVNGISPTMPYSLHEEYIYGKRSYSNAHIVRYPVLASANKNGVPMLWHSNEWAKDFANLINKTNIHLRVALDIPQLYTSYGTSLNNKKMYSSLLLLLMEIREYINGVRLWGKRTSDKCHKVAHVRDLTSYFNNDLSLKNEFMSVMYSLFDNDKVCNMILEVNSSNEDLLFITNDLINFGFDFNNIYSRID